MPSSDLVKLALEWDSQVSRLRDQIIEKDESISSLQTELAVVKAQLAECQKDGETPSYPGKPSVTNPLWGTSVLNNADAKPQFGKVQIQRVFYQWTHWDKPYLTDVLDRHKNDGTLSYVSFKTPSGANWKAMPEGVHNTGMDRILAELESREVPVWFSFYHEPEDNTEMGSPGDWRAMQEWVRGRMNAVGTEHVAFAPTLMSWTWDSRSGRNPEDWWVDGIFDFLGIDHYSNRTSSQPQELLTPVWQSIQEFAAAKGVDIALGEWAILGDSAEEMQRFHDQGGAVAYSYYNENQSGVADWRLSGERLTKFKEILARKVT